MIGVALFVIATLFLFILTIASFFAETLKKDLWFALIGLYISSLIAHFALHL